jgi:hypothetical protein
MNVLTISNLAALKWASEVGRVYRVQYRTNLVSGSWKYVSGELSATKTNTSFVLPASTTGSQFLRIVGTRP